jgi:YHS domain-containing protein
MLRTLIVEFLLPLLLFLLLRNLLRGLFSGRTPQRAEQPPQPPPVSAGGELKKDPVCGTYVSTATALQEKRDGAVAYFCSEECRRKFLTEPRG